MRECHNTLDQSARAQDHKDKALINKYMARKKSLASKAADDEEVDQERSPTKKKQKRKDTSDSEDE